MKVGHGAFEQGVFVWTCVFLLANVVAPQRFDLQAVDKAASEGSAIELTEWSQSGLVRAGHDRHPR